MCIIYGVIMRSIAFCWQCDGCSGLGIGFQNGLQFLKVYQLFTSYIFPVLVNQSCFNPIPSSHTFDHYQFSAENIELNSLLKNELIPVVED